MRTSDAVLVVGGSAGIGASVAEACADRAVVWSRRTGVDATDPDQVARAAAELLQRGAPWGLVHAVGDFAERPLLATEPELFQSLLQSNVTSAFHVLRAVVPAMVASRRGRVILFSAAGADSGRAMTRAPVYFAFKAALVQMARSLAKEVAPSGVTVNVVSPGLIRHPDSHHESQARMLPRVPAGRFGTVGDVVGLVLWLLSEESGYVTGADLAVDGGLSL